MRRSAPKLVVSTLMLAFAATASLADSWMPPGEATYDSRGKEFRFTVLPRIISSPGDYWRDYDLGPHKRGQQTGKRDVCIGRLEKRAAGGSYTVVWERELVNDVSPVTALVTVDGSHVVTFDNWHFRGYGKDVVVIYGPGGKLVASLGLSDFLSMEQVAGLPRTVSSIHWGGAHHFDDTEELVVLQIATGNPGSVSIALADGRIRATGGK